MTGQRVALTGGSRGIGFATAEQLARDGCAVVIADRNADAVAASVELVSATGTAWGLPGEFTDPEHISAVFTHAMTRHGRTDALVNNAGAHVVELLVLPDDDDALRELFRVNVVAARAWVRAAYWAYVRESGGSVVNVTSVAGVRGEKGIGGYGVSEAALAHLTAQLAVEPVPSVRLNAVAPGFTLTDGPSLALAGREQACCGADHECSVTSKYFRQLEERWIC